MLNLVTDSVKHTVSVDFGNTSVKGAILNIN